MRLKVLDGAESIGGTKILLESAQDGVLLDFGLNFSQYGKFYEEFVRPRASKGLTDLLRMGLVPSRPSWYRRDLGAATDSGSDTLELGGVLLSHAHVDHCGMLGVLRTEIPVHATPQSIAIMRASQESGRPDFWGETCHAVPKVLCNRDQIIRSAGTSTPAVGRSFVCTREASVEFHRIMRSLAAASPRSRQLAPGSIASSDGRIGAFTYRAHAVDHSLPGCCAFTVCDSHHTIIYTGDLRFHGRDGHLTEAFVRQAAEEPPDVLVVEGTRIGRKPGPQITEADVACAAHDIVTRSRSRLVIADFGPRHVERLASFLAIAKCEGRRLILTAKDIFLLEMLIRAGEARVDPGDPAIGLFDEPRAVQQTWEGGVVDRHQAQLVSASDVSKDPGAYILAFSFFDLPELIDIGIGGVYIYSSSEAYTEDQKIDVRRLVNWTREFDFELHGVTLEDGLAFDIGLNSSGHLSEEDLRGLIREIRPKSILPVHTEQPAWFSGAAKEIGADLLIPDATGQVGIQ